MLNQERIHYMDSMRAILMVLGILLHTANIYSPVHNWLVSSEETHLMFGMISNFINLFRMPTFFMVSGFFLSYIYLKRQRIDIVDRVFRLVVPLVFTAVTLNVAQEVILKAYYDSPLDLVNFFSTGAWVSHLWFLINLTIYNLIVWAFFQISLVHRLLHTVSDVLAGKHAYLIAILAFPLIISGIYGLNRVINIYSFLFNVTSPFLLLFYFQFFLIGVLFGYNSSLLKRFSTPGIPEFLTFALAYILSFSIQRFTPSETFLNDVFSAYNQSIAILFLSSMCFFLFRHFLDRKNQVLGLISDSAYSIYLLHHLLVVGLGILFVSLMVTPYIAYPVIVTLVFTLTLLAHQAISRSAILVFLLNGVRPGKARAAAKAPDAYSATADYKR